MHQRATASSDFVIRPPATPEETETFFRLQSQIFRPNEDIDIVTAHRSRFTLQDPAIRPEQIRGAYLDGKCIGGYVIFERKLCLGPSRLLSGCINSVFTSPDYRHQGVAAALMQDAIEYAQQHRHALLFLHGLPNFYPQFGYADVMEDMPRHYFSRMAIPEPYPTDYQVREATINDAEALLTLYQRHYGSYLASFAPERTIERQIYLINNWFQLERHILLALDQRQEIQGYLSIQRKWGRLEVYEAATENWPATLALLQAHAHLLDQEEDSQQQMFWPLPPSDKTFLLLTEHLPIRSEIISIPFGGWMARLVNYPTLFQAMLPLWDEYWRRRPGTFAWIGTLAITVDDYTTTLALGPSEIYLMPGAVLTRHHIKLTAQAFTQLIFGFRPVEWFLDQSGLEIPEDLVPLLNVLFPVNDAWIAGSDYF